MSKKEKLLICGSQTVLNEKYVQNIFNRFSGFSELIVKYDPKSNTPSGVNAMVYKLAINLHKKVKCFKPETPFSFLHLEMVDYCDAGIIIWNGQDQSTKDLLQKLTKAGKLFKVFYYKRNTDFRSRNGGLQ